LKFIVRDCACIRCHAGEFPRQPRHAAARGSRLPGDL